MADIVDPKINKIVSEILRPLSEELKVAGLNTDITVDEWERYIDDALQGYDDADVVVNPHEPEGLRVITIGDLKAFGQAIAGLQQGYQAQNITDIIYKLCVRNVKAR